jgi:lipopolysaccharide transport system ATP-binding protein
MPDTVITVEKLSKRYLVGHQAAQRGRRPTLRDAIVREVRGFTQKVMDVARGRQIVLGDEVEEFWALKNVSFEVKRGDVFGIIGRNGAGKSTLLKILSRITEPTKGRVRLRGRVASLLEVGTGFHQELTGRENIFLNGAILGMTNQEVRRKFDEIVAFAEVENFLDTPVKRYSSGMYVRLAFAVAAHLEPEILVVDEVLAVGDAEFQKKCLGKMDDVSRREGRTVLFVSHNMSAVATLCSSAIWLDKGEKRLQGPTRDVIHEYIARTATRSDVIVPTESAQRRGFVKDNRLRITSLEWLGELPLKNSEPVSVRLTFNTKVPVKEISASLFFSAVEGTCILAYNSDFAETSRPDILRPGEYSTILKIDSLPLQAEIYDIGIAFRSGEVNLLDYVDGVTRVEVVAGPKTPLAIAQKFAGVRLPCTAFWKLPTSVEVTTS